MPSDTPSAEVTSSGPTQDPVESLALGEVIGLALWLGVLTGLGELCLFAIKRYLLGTLLLVSPHVVWMAPLCDVLIFITVGVAVWLAGAAVHRVRGTRWQLFAFFFLGVIAALLQYRRIGEWAMVILAAGVAFQLSGFLAARPRLLGRVRRATAAPAIAIVLALAAGVVIRGVRAESNALGSLPDAPADAPDVILIVLDTQRAQSSSLHGYERPTTLFLEEFAEGGVAFERAFATSPWTLPSHATMFTGRYPLELSARNLTALDDVHASLPEVLSGVGYATAGFVANLFYAVPELGLARGFSRYEAFPISWAELLTSSMLGRRIGNSSFLRNLTGYYDILGRKPASHVSRDFLDWLDARDDRPYFAFLNFHDPHDPYLAPEAYEEAFGSRRQERDFSESFFWTRQATVFERAGFSDAQREAEIRAYDAAIAYLDAELKALFDELERRGRLDDALIVITSDHGEHFGEQKNPSGEELHLHANSLYTQLTWVPLVVRYPRAVPAGVRVQEPVTLRDLPRTVLDLAGLDSSDGTDVIPGNSWEWTWNAGPNPEPRSPIVSSLFDGDADASHHSIVLEGLHYIRWADGTEELFDLAVDMEDAHNLVGTARADERMPALRAALETALRDGGPR